jgi:hypothetical protein
MSGLMAKPITLQLLLFENTDVPNGEANSTLHFLVKIHHLNEGVTEDDFKVINFDGFWVRTIKASKVDYLLCQFTQSIKHFKVHAQMNQCSINMLMELIPRMKMRHAVSANGSHMMVLTDVVFLS